MYKGASQGLQHRHGVDRPHPSRGFIDGASDPLDVLPDVSALSVAQLRSERDQLRVEVKRHEQDLSVAKALRNHRAVGEIGQRKAALALRLSAVKTRLAELDGPTENQILGRAIREVAGDALADRIFERAREMRKLPRIAEPPPGDPQ